MTGWRNRVSSILGTEYPILLGPMRLITLGELAAAVSECGGFDQVAASGLEGEQLRKERVRDAMCDETFLLGKEAMPIRVLKNEVTARVAGMEQPEADKVIISKGQEVFSRLTGGVDSILERLEQSLLGRRER
jgi:hypothetical protein